jgi:hypothetical protein
MFFNESVTPCKAETTITIGNGSDAMIFFTILILSELPREDPPNFRTFIKDYV